MTSDMHRLLFGSLCFALKQYKYRKTLSFTLLEKNIIITFIIGTFFLCAK